MAAVRPYRVSTITWNGAVGTAVDYAIFFEHVRIVSIEDAAFGFVWADFRGERTRGVNPKRAKAVRKPPTERPKCFDNQLTLVARVGEGYHPNVKLFHNGNVHITGIRTPEDGVRINELLVSEIHRIGAEHPSVAADLANAKAGAYAIRMINSDFTVPYMIRRKDLHHLLISPTYQNQCVFDPEKYPGVKLKFFWNRHHALQNGICQCAGKCLGKGSGHGEGDCKKVTVAIFESGSILITGANAFEQIDDAYAYINVILERHNAALKKNLLPQLLPAGPL